MALDGDNHAHACTGTYGIHYRSCAASASLFLKQCGCPIPTVDQQTTVVSTGGFQAAIGCRVYVAGWWCHRTVADIESCVPVSSLMVTPLQSYMLYMALTRLFSCSMMLYTHLSIVTNTHHGEDHSISVQVVQPLP